MIKINLNISYYFLNDDMRMSDITYRTTYIYPPNKGIVIEDGVLQYSDRDMIVEHFKNYDVDSFCYLDNNISISLFSKTKYERFIRLVKINNIKNSSDW
jgi:hypothetical protein